MLNPPPPSSSKLGIRAVAAPSPADAAIGPSTDTSPPIARRPARPTAPASSIGVVTVAAKPQQEKKRPRDAGDETDVAKHRPSTKYQRLMDPIEKELDNTEPNIDLIIGTYQGLIEQGEDCRVSICFALQTLFCKADSETASPK